MKIASELTKKYNGVWKIWVGNDLLLYTNNVKDCHKFLTSEDALEKADIFYTPLRKLAKEGLFFSRGKLNARLIIMNYIVIYMF